MGSYTITYPDDLWEKFKTKITKDKTINEAIVELIKKFVEENE
ncbi:MAG: hypothetical protein QW228_07615 [Candidatus Aenigmatarchaeota archaeon]